MSNDVNFKKLNELEVIEEAGESTYAVVEENGVPKRIPGKKIGGGLPSGGAPYQQLVTDGEGVAKWEDRPFYEKIGEVVVIPETTFLPENIMGSSGISIANPKFITFIEGQTYTVIYDNNTYELIAAPDEGIVALSLEDVNVKIAVVPGAEEVFTVLTPDGWGVEHIIKVTTIETVITKIDSKFMPDGYPRSETKEVTFLPETSVAFEWDASGVGHTSVPCPSGMLEDGKTYAITVNGETYTCKAVRTDDENGYDISCGKNRTAAGEDPTGEPFFILSHPNWPDELIVRTTNDLLPTPSIFTVVEIEETIHPLDTKYLPTIVFRSLYDPVTYEGEGEVECNRTHDQIRAMYESGYPMIIYFLEKVKGMYDLVFDEYSTMTNHSFAILPEDGGFAYILNGHIRNGNANIAIVGNPDGSIVVEIN